MHIRRGTAAIILIFLSMFNGHTPALGRTEFKIGSFRAGAEVIVSEEEIIGEELLAAGANVKAAGEMETGLKVFGANVIIPGRVKGKLYAFGANVSLSGTFHDQVTAAAANIVLSGNFKKDIDRFILLAAGSGSCCDYPGRFASTSRSISARIASTVLSIRSPSISADRCMRCT
jgi:hypothetical protein